jgi:hypothetical protein
LIEETPQGGGGCLVFSVEGERVGGLEVGAGAIFGGEVEKF